MDMYITIAYCCINNGDVKLSGTFLTVCIYYIVLWLLFYSSWVVRQCMIYEQPRKLLIFIMCYTDSSDAVG